MISSPLQCLILSTLLSRTLSSLSCWCLLLILPFRGDPFSPPPPSPSQLGSASLSMMAPVPRGPLSFWRPLCRLVPISVSTFPAVAHATPGISVAGSSSPSYPAAGPPPWLPVSMVRTTWRQRRALVRNHGAWFRQHTSATAKYSPSFALQQLSAPSLVVCLSELVDVCLRQCSDEAVRVLTFIIAR